MEVQVNPAQSVVFIGDCAYPFDLDCHGDVAKVELDSVRYVISPLTWRSKCVLARYAYVGPAFIRQQFLKLSLPKRARIPQDEKAIEVLLALAQWINNPEGRDDNLPLQSQILANVTLDLCAAMDVLPGAFDDRNAYEVETLWRVVSGRHYSKRDQSSITNLWSTASHPIAAASGEMVRINIVPDPGSTSSEKNPESDYSKSNATYIQPEGELVDLNASRSRRNLDFSSSEEIALNDESHENSPLASSKESAKDQRADDFKQKKSSAEKAGGQKRSKREGHPDLTQKSRGQFKNVQILSKSTIMSTLRRDELNRSSASNDRRLDRLSPRTRKGLPLMSTGGSGDTTGKKQLPPQSTKKVDAIHVDSNRTREKQSSQIASRRMINEGNINEGYVSHFERDSAIHHPQTSDLLKRTENIPIPGAEHKLNARQQEAILDLFSERLTEAAEQMGIPMEE